MSHLREQLNVFVIPFDRMTYATAQIAEWPLLFKGNDFAQTDIERA